MSGHEPFTPTRQMAQSAAQKASDAYAMMRQFQERAAGLEARIEALEAENAILNDRLVRIEDAPLKLVTRRKAA